MADDFELVPVDYDPFDLSPSRELDFVPLEGDHWDPGTRRYMVASGSQRTGCIINSDQVVSVQSVLAPRTTAAADSDRVTRRVSGFRRRPRSVRLRCRT